MSKMQLAAKAGLLHRKQPAADAGCCSARQAKAVLRKWSPSRRSAALCAEQYSAGCKCRLAALKSGCECGLLYWLSESMAAQMEPGGRSAALSAERNAAECVSRLAAARATDCECGLLPCTNERSTAAATKPDRAGVHRLQG